MRNLQHQACLFKQLADENYFKELQLVMGIFKMNTLNTPAVKNTLKKYRLEYIPEAHNYLRYEGEIMDCSKTNWQISDFENDILEEIEILPDQITDYKVKYHKKFLEKWLLENELVPYNLEQFLKIREECIVDLSN